MSDNAKALLQKACTECGVERPLSDYRRRRPGSEQRQHQCRLCHNAAMRRFRSVRRRKAIGGFADRLIAGSSLDRLDALYGRLMRRFGGSARFADEWVAQIRAANSSRPGHPFALKSCVAITQLCLLVSPPRVQSADDELDDLTDAELEAEIERLLGQLAQ